MTSMSLLLLLLAGCVSELYASTAINDAERILNKRDVHDNIRKNDPKSKCRNGGIYAGGQCHCIHPHTGKTCEEFACVHGISVGRRYDPLSLIFSKPCICNEGWKGDLCEYHLTDRCGNRGEWKNNKCECIGSFFGDECQFTSRCDNGVIKHGRCICNKHFEGDYCERIICYHGYPNIKNMSLSCICPAKYKGLHCDQCSQVGPKIQPYPICTVNYIPSHARQSRKKTNQQIKYRFVIMTGAVTFLVVIAVSMCAFHIWHQRRKNPEEEAVRLQALSERSQMLTDAALHPESEVQTTITKKERRRSLTNPFRLKRSASADRGVPRFKGKEYSDNFTIEKN
ncbi:hypothetical protein Y032_0022g477 [Ancylostoma ceylanicum]|uniref:EGF-like domain-containing protein n=2 Tax=Ancylostoma ceylanicum TaxID=53326 RepID=A0A016V097_9BILA|nr:hypothetical protein Y032_0022g477 [Ancylostoma ceylanicum]